MRVDQIQWTSPLHDPAVFDTDQLLIVVIKFADLGHSTKPLPVHEAWTNRITREFWALGDREKQLGVAVSPLCDRETDHDIAKSQIGFFQYICGPFYTAVADLCSPDLEPCLQARWRCHGRRTICWPYAGR